MEDKLKQQLDFLIEADKMKSIYRRTMLIDMSRNESDAEHSWHFALAAYLLREYAADEVDINRVIKMALVHDMVEIYAGDTFAYDTAAAEDKRERENAAADKLFAMLPSEQGAELRALWEEFDDMQSPDALFATAIDRLQPFISNFMTQGHTWSGHKVTVEMVLRRMEPIRTAMPKLWEFIETSLANAIERGYIT